MSRNPFGRMTHKSIAVIGHVDHGKTALVEALTGTNTDTLAEERARGLTITLGFAHLQMSAGTLHFIDAPGHADFIRTTVSGLSGVDAVLLVVSASEGIEAQTREHFRLARLLGIERVMVALTKCDLASEAIIETRRAEINALAVEAGDSSLPIISCSARASDGLRDLIRELVSFLSVPASRAKLTGFFLPIDRVFSAPGVGTIVTGTLIGGGVESGTDASIGTEIVTVRGIQVAGEPVASASSGSRVALNLRGVDQSEVRKGDVVCASNAFEPSSRFDAVLRGASGERPKLKHMDQVMIMAGTAYLPARVRMISSGTEPGEPVFAQLELRQPLVGYHGQHFVLRNPAASETVVGGTILDPIAPTVPRRKPLHLAVLRAAETSNPVAISHALADRDHGEVRVKDAARLSGKTVSEVEDALRREFLLASPKLALRHSEVRSATGEFREALTSLHRARPIRPFHASATVTSKLRQAPASILDWVERDLVRSGEVLETASGLALASHDPRTSMTPQQLLDNEQAAARLAEMGLRPKPLFADQTTSAEQEDLIELLIHLGVAVRLYNHGLRQHILLHADVVAAAQDTLRKQFPHGTPFTTGEARAALATNRKTVVPLLELFDRKGVTSREEDVRILAA